MNTEKTEPTPSTPTHDLSAMDGFYKVGKHHFHKPGQLLAIELFKMRMSCSKQNLTLAQTDVVMMSFILGAGNLENAFKDYKARIESQIEIRNVPSLAEPPKALPTDQPKG